jgi:HK97 gp10 family phage protein
MAFKIRMRITGVAELISKLRTLDDKVRRKALRSGIAKAGRIIAKDAKDRVQRRSGQLARSIGSKVKVYRNGGAVVAIVGPRKGFKIIVDGKPVDPVRYAHLVEAGTSHSAAFPFLRPAVDENQQRILGAIADAVTDALQT